MIRLSKLVLNWIVFHPNKPCHFKIMLLKEAVISYLTKCYFGKKN